MNGKFAQSFSLADYKKMKYLFYLLISLGLLGLSSCNQDKVKALEHQITSLKAENQSLKSHIKELEGEIYNLKDCISSQNRQLEQNKWHIQNAQQHLQDAKFWNQNGNNFLFESYIRNAKRELDMIH